MTTVLLASLLAQETLAPPLELSIEAPEVIDSRSSLPFKLTIKNTNEKPLVLMKVQSPADWTAARSTVSLHHGEKNFAAFGNHTSKFRTLIGQYGGGSHDVHEDHFITIKPGATHALGEENLQTFYFVHPTDRAQTKQTPLPNGDYEFRVSYHFQQAPEPHLYELPGTGFKAMSIGPKFQSEKAKELYNQAWEGSVGATHKLKVQPLPPSY